MELTRQVRPDTTTAVVAEAPAGHGLAEQPARAVPLPGLAVPIRRTSSTATLIQRLTDAEGKAVDTARIENSTSEADLNAWRKLADWDEDDLVAAIDLRLQTLGNEAKDTARKKAEDDKAGATKAASERAEAERLRVKAELEAVLGGTTLDNFDLAVDTAVRDRTANNAKKTVEMSAYFFKAVAALAPAQTAREVLDDMTDDVALETFILGNGRDDVSATTVLNALDVAIVWQRLQQASTVLESLEDICAQIRAGRIVPVRKVYREAKITSNSGFIYNFTTLNGRRALAGAEWHLHGGVNTAGNKPGFKDRAAKFDSDRVETNAAAFAKLKGAIASRGLWQD
ncbi:MAG: hypothetical protein JWO57_2307 [Pseudonocardiales bacterium]|nr:hypothetical protein [Pseudonocardiales bacterium]